MGVVGNFFKGWGRAGQLIVKGTHPRGMPIGLKTKLEEGENCFCIPPLCGYTSGRSSNHPQNR